MNIELTSYKGGSPQEFAILKGWSQDIATWNSYQEVEFQHWAGKQMDAAGFGTYEAPKLPGQGGFGPGEYLDGYMGTNDRLYWGSRQAGEAGVEMQPMGEGAGADVTDLVSQHSASSAGGWETVPSESMYSGTYQTSTQGSMGDPDLMRDFGVGGEGRQLDPFATPGETIAQQGRQLDPFATPGETIAQQGRQLDPFATPGETIAQQGRQLDPFATPGETIAETTPGFQVGEGSELSFADSLVRPPPGTYTPFEGPEGYYAGRLTAYKEIDLLKDTLNLGGGEPIGNIRGDFHGDLSSIPDVPQLPAGAFEGLSPAELSSFNDAFEAARIGTSAAGESLFGVSELVTQFRNFLPGLALTPFIMWLQRQGKAGKTAVDVINISGGMAALMASNPLGVIGSVAGVILQTYGEQRARIQSNNWGERVSDSRYAMVEDGGVWYPAVLRSRIKGEGLFDDSNQVTLVYGRSDDFYLAQDNAGQVRAHFTHPKTRNFRMSDWEYDSTGIERMNIIDPYRQFYFIPEDEITGILKNYGTKDFSWAEKVRDTSDYTPFMKFESDFISQLDFIKSQNDPLSDPTLNTIPASKSFRWNFNELKQLGTQAFQDPEIRDGLKGSFPTDSYGEDTWYNDIDKHWYQAGRGGLNEWKDVLTTYLPQQMLALYRTRKSASEEVGVEDRFYADWDKDIPPAGNLEELRQQYALINSYTDRTNLQKNYLKQKAATRSMLKAVSSAGYGSGFYDTVHKSKGDDFSLKGLLPWASDPASVEALPAWINKGEDGVPDWIDLSSGRRAKTDDTAKYFDTFLSWYQYVDPNKKISDFGKLHGMTKSEKDKKIEDDKAKMREDLQTDIVRELSPVIAPPKMRGDMTREDWYLLQMFKKKQRRIKIKEDWKAKLKTVHERLTGEDLWMIPEEQPADKWEDYGVEDYGDMTYEKFIELVNNPMESVPNRLQERSLAHVYENLLLGNYKWAPKNLVLDQQNLPSYILQGSEDSFKPMLASISKDSDLRQRADRLHNLVHKPDTQEYLERYHHTAQMSNPELSKDASGTTELFSDWAEPYEKRQNVVRFNGMIHTQMDFGVSETV